MDTRQDIDRVLEQIGEPPLSSRDVVQQTERIVTLGGGNGAGKTIAAADVADDKHIDLVEPSGHRRANLVFTNGRHLFIDMQDDELRAVVRGHLRRRRRWLFRGPEFLTLPVIDVVGADPKKEGSGVVVASPIHLTQKACESIQSIGRSWLPRVPGKASAGSKVTVIRGSDAAAVLEQLPLNRAQRRRLRMVDPDRG